MHPTFRLFQMFGLVRPFPSTRVIARLVAGGLFTAGAGSVIYSKVIIPTVRRRQIRDMPPPVRRTALFVAGHESIGEISSLHRVVFFFYAAWRMALLFIEVVPVLFHLIRIKWYSNASIASNTAAFDVILRLFVKMGPTYIKLGQWIATRPDVFPLALCQILAQLFDKTPPHSWAYTHKVLQRQGILDYLDAIDTKPINSGSIAQVYKASLKSEVDGVSGEVAVKVTHPNIVNMMLADISVMQFGAWLLECIPGMKYLALQQSAYEFAALLLSQLDLERECDNLMQFRYNFRGSDQVVFPRPAPSLCSKEVLVESFEYGVPISNDAKPSSKLADAGCLAFLKMVFEDNFVHADLHPGNVLLRVRNTSDPKANPKDGLFNRDEIVLLDPGLVTSLGERERDNLITLFTAVACGDGEVGANIILKRTPGQECADSVKFRKAMKDIFDVVSPKAGCSFALRRVDMGDVLIRLSNTMREHRVRIDGSFASLVATVVVGEGLGRKMHPDYNMFEGAVPFLIRNLKGNELEYMIGRLKESYAKRNS